MGTWAWAGKMRCSAVCAQNSSGLKRVLSIDIGMSNFAFCYYDISSDSILEWRRLSLPEKGKMLLIPRLVGFVHDFKREHAVIAEEATLVAVEQQMTASMRIMEAVCHSLFAGKARSVNPRQVKRYYREQYPLLVPVHKEGKTSRSIEYGMGKRLIVAVARDMLPTQTDPQWQQYFAGEKKKDDIADCFTQAVYVSRHRALYNM